MVSPPYIRAISSTCSSSVNAFAVISVRSPTTFFSTRKCLSAKRAICGRCVIQITWENAESSFNFSHRLKSATFCAPAENQFHRNSSVGTSSTCTNNRSCSARFNNTYFHRARTTNLGKGPLPEPTFGAIKNSTSSIPSERNA